MRRTSYEIQWQRALPTARPDFATGPHSETFVSPDGEPLFTVVTHGGPSEGIFNLIEHAPRLRDELDAGAQE